MPRPEFPTGTILTATMIHEINARQSHYDEDPERAEQEQLHTEEERAMYEEQMRQEEEAAYQQHIENQHRQS